ncbi:hypothetical protein D3C87_2054790 [compost metagenome]
MPSPLTTRDSSRGLLGLRLGAAALAGAFLSPFFSVFFFLVPAALPDALTFFGPL